MTSTAALHKALAEMEAIAKGGDQGPGNKTPKSTKQANGGLSSEGDSDELNVDGDLGGTPAAGVSKGEKKKKGKSFKEWAKEEESEEAHKAEDEDEIDLEKGDDEEASEEESDDGEEMEKAKKKKKAMKKSSIADLIKSDSDAGPVVDISPFVEQLVDQVSDSDMALRKSVRAMANDQRNFFGLLGKVVKGLVAKIDSIEKSIEEFGDAPAPQGRKSMLSKSEVDERFEEEQPEHSKLETLDLMVDLAKSGAISPVAVTLYEEHGHMEPDVQAKVEKAFSKKSA